MVVPTITPPDARDTGGTSRSLHATHVWLFGAEFDLDDAAALDDPGALLLACVATSWTTEPPHEQQPAGLDPPIERALRELATRLGVTGDPLARETARRALFRTGTPPHLVTSVDNGRNGLTVTAKGDVDAVLRCCTQLLDDQGRAVPLTREARLHLRQAVTRHAADGRPVLAVAHRPLGVGHPVPADQRQAETDLILIGLVAMADPLSTLAHPQLAALRLAGRSAEREQRARSLVPAVRRHWWRRRRSALRPELLRSPGQLDIADPQQTRWDATGSPTPSESTPPPPPGSLQADNHTAT